MRDGTGKGEKVRGEGLTETKGTEKAPRGKTRFEENVAPSPSPLPFLPPFLFPVSSSPLPPSASALALGADEAVDWLRRVVAGERIWLVVDKAGEESIRSATGDETMVACDKLLKFGAGVKEPPATPPDDMAARLDRLSPEDLATMREIAERAQAASETFGASGIKKL